MNSNNLVKGITTANELLTAEYGEKGTIERTAFEAKARGWSEGYKEGYEEAIKDMRKKMKKLLKQVKPEGDE